MDVSRNCEQDFKELGPSMHCEVDKHGEEPFVCTDKFIVLDGLMDFECNNGLQNLLQVKQKSSFYKNMLIFQSLGTKGSAASKQKES